ncbi:hypothetical protein EV424DRAFT_1538689 [Suillus variegatus]|nr:hypothetical protein EV424DRAFT_1538689 [Suillus variegatus]
MARRKRSPSLSQSENSDSSSDLDNSRRSPSPTHKNAKKRGRSRKSVQSRDATPKKVKISKDTDEDLDEEYFAAARAMTRCYDLFCKVEKLIKIGCLLQQDEAADKGDLEEDEADKVSRKKRLEGLSTYVRDRYKRNYHQLLQLAPGLRALINNKNKSKQLARIARKMNGIISAMRSDDSTRLKSQIGHYAV